MKGQPFVQNFFFVDRTIVWYLIVHLNIFRYSKLFFLQYPERRECYYESDFGKSYNGRANVTASGTPCLPWAESTNFLYKYRDGSKDTFESNYCRAYENNSYKSGEPLCLVKYPSVQKRCGVQKCGEVFFLRTFVKPKYFVKKVCHFSISLLEQNIV